MKLQKRCGIFKLIRYFLDIRAADLCVDSRLAWKKREKFLEQIVLVAEIIKLTASEGLFKIPEQFACFS